MQNNNCCDDRQNCCPKTIDRTIYKTILGTTGATGATGATGPTGPTGATGTSTTLEASINRNDTTQTVVENNVVSITGTNVLTVMDSDMLFVNNMVRLGSAGVYLINATIEITGTAGVSNNFAVNVGGTDYTFTVIINDDATIGTISHTIFLNIATNNTDVSIYNRNNTSVTVSKAELDVIKLA